MSNILFQAAAFIVAIGILIVVHEFGHFWVARRVGVKVLRFSIGFGKPLWTRRIGPDAMEFVVAMLPLGGYVKMLDEREGEVGAHERHRAFNRQAIWKRMAVVVAGPLFNLAFAVVAYAGVYLAGVEGLKPVVSAVVPNSIAQRAGFHKGDEIVAIDGKPVRSWDQRRLYLFQRALDRARVDVEVRDTTGTLREHTLDLSEIPVSRINAGLLEQGIGLIAYVPQPLPAIGVLDPGPAKDAGMEVGDRITAVDGRPISTWSELADAINRSPGKLVHLTVERNGERKEISVTPVAEDVNGKTIGLIHIRPEFAPVPDDMRVRVRLGPVGALAEGLNNTWSMSWLTLEMFYRMLRLEVSTKNISGPITIAQYAGYSARVGPEQFILFLAVVSISLGVLNLLPIPVLDGGHLLYFVIEAVTGKPVSERSLAIGQQVGIAILVGLMSLAFYNDITRLLH
jgi:regulator of sigma E protease